MKRNEMHYAAERNEINTSFVSRLWKEPQKEQKIYLSFSRQKNSSWVAVWPRKSVYVDCPNGEMVAMSFKELLEKRITMSYSKSNVYLNFVF